jgi:arylsulfatase A-like enzyme
VNVILLTLDCVRADHWADPGLTPRFHALAGEGTTFAQAFSQSQNTLSSHLSMLTSNYLFQHGVYSNFAYKDLPEHSLPRRLEAAGWDTQAFVGVDFLADVLGNQIGGEDPRFSRPSAFETRVVRSLRRIPQLSALVEAFQRRRGRRARAEETLERGLAWLSAPERRPHSFLWMHLFDAHMLYDAPGRYLEQHAPRTRAPVPLRGEIDRRGWITGEYPEELWRVPFEYFPARYRAAVAYQDDCLANFVQGLKAIDLWDDTLLILTADHGECLLGDHGTYCSHRKLFDTTVHVPLWIRFPGGAHAGQAVDAIVQHVDLAPTVAKLADVDGSLYMGRDLAAVAAGDDDGHAYAFAEHVHDLQRAVRDREWLLLEPRENPEAPWTLPREEHVLFRRDSTPVANADGAAHAQRLRGRMEELLRSRPEIAAAWMDATEVDEALRSRLAELGYL